MVNLGRHLISFLLLVFLLSVSIRDRSWATAYPPCDPLRKNYFCIDPNSPESNGATREDYYYWTNQIMGLFTLEIFQKFKVSFLIPDLWEAPYFGGGSELNQQDPEYFIPLAKIKIFGGTVRSPEAKGMAFATTLCHEVGHFLGDGPRQNISGAEWSSLEGFSDDYAARVCLPQVIQKFPEKNYQESQILPEIKSLCAGHFMCQQVAQSGFDFTTMIHTYAKSAESAAEPLQIQIGTATEVQEMVQGYPTGQCRLETYLQAALCLKSDKNENCLPPPCWYPKEPNKSNEQQSQADPARD